MRTEMSLCHRAICSMGYILILIILLSINGCSYIMIDHYYAPISQDKKEVPYSVTTCEHTFFSTGPEETIKIDSDDIEMVIVQGSNERNLTYISAGPFVFPVIPIFPINWFKSDKNQFLTLKLDMKIKNDGKINWYIKETTIVTPDNNRINPTMYYGLDYRGYYTKTFVPVDDTMLELRSPAAHFELRYPLTAKTAVSAFRLSLKGLSTTDKLIVLPEVEFQGASSWKMCGAP